LCAREVRKPEALLRLALAYGVAGMSLRETESWAKTRNLADLSDVALLNRLRAATPWLGGIVGKVLASQAEPVPQGANGRRICLIDATSIRGPGSAGTDWRIHLRFDLQRLSIIDAQVTDAHGGETVARHIAEPGDIVIGGRAYGSRRGLAHLPRAGADVLVRLTWHNLPLSNMDGEPFDLFAALRSVPNFASETDPSASGNANRLANDDSASTAPIEEFLVMTVPTKEHPAMKGRLIAIRKSKAKADADRAKIKRENSKKGRKTDLETLEAAGYTFVFTTLSMSEISAADALALYCFRWQIELAFKRLKILLNLDVLLARDRDLAQIVLYVRDA